MAKPRIFLGSSGKQAKLLQALARGLGEIAEVEPWTTSFNPGVGTLERLVELTREVDFAVFIFGADDWTAADASPEATGQASPRDNVVFEAGLFGGVLGMHRTFILHAHGAKLPSDLLGLTAVRYDSDTTPSGMRAINQKLRDAIDAVDRPAKIEGAWWQFSLTPRTEKERAALSLLNIKHSRDGTMDMAGRSWQADGKLCVRYWSVATRANDDSFFYYWNGERPLEVNTPQVYGTGEIKLESGERANGYFTVRSDQEPELNARTSGIYWRADPDDVAVLDGRDDQKRAALIAERLKEWEAVRNG